MVMVEEDSKTVLMTGDGHPEDLMFGLDNAGKLRADGTLHVDVLKMLHHGSKNNWTPEFGKQVTADHYVFCGNGAHENPHHDVVEGVINSRLGSTAQRSKNPETGNSFRLSFNSSESVTKGKKQKHMKALKKQVDKAASTSGGKLKSFFLTGSKFDINL